MKIKAEIVEKEMKETVEKINKTKSLFFKKTSKVDKFQPDSSRKKEKSQINKIRNENGDVTSDNAKMQMIIKDYYEQLYVDKMYNLEEMERFLEKLNLPRLNQKKKKKRNYE